MTALHPIFAAAVAANAPAPFAREFEGDSSKPFSRMTERELHEHYGQPTGPEPERCWSCNQPIRGEVKGTPDGPECRSCTIIGYQVLVDELGMTPEEFIKIPAGGLARTSAEAGSGAVQALTVPLTAGTDRHNFESLAKIQAHPGSLIQITDPDAIGGARSAA